MKDEHWKRIEHFSRYVVSDKGNVKSVKFNRVLKTAGEKGESIGLISDSGDTRRISIGRLVLSTFVEFKPSNKYIVGHKDGNTKNNSLENIYWKPREGYSPVTYFLKKDGKTSKFYRLKDLTKAMGYSTYRKTYKEVSEFAKAHGYEIDKKKRNVEEHPIFPRDKDKVSSSERKAINRKKVDEFVKYCEDNYSKTVNGVTQIGDIDESDPVVIKFREYQSEYIR